MDTRIKMIYLTDIPSMDLFAASERWLKKYHSLETMQWIGPYLAEYYSYLSVPPTEEARKVLPLYGNYNWRMTGHVYNGTPPNPPGVWRMTAGTPHPRNEGQTLEELYGEKDYTKKLPYHQPAVCYTNYYPDEDYKGKDYDIYGKKQVIRWVMLLRYPEGADPAEIDSWYTKTHAEEVSGIPEVQRFYSYRCIVPDGYDDPGFNRVSEIWFENHSAWLSFLEKTADFTPPPVKEASGYPFFRPYENLFSIFILESPTNDFLRDFRGYYARP